MVNMVDDSSPFIRGKKIAFPEPYSKERLVPTSPCLESGHIVTTP